LPKLGTANRHANFLSFFSQIFDASKIWCFSKIEDYRNFSFIFIFPVCLNFAIYFRLTNVEHAQSSRPNKKSRKKSQIKKSHFLFLFLRILFCFLVLFRLVTMPHLVEFTKKYKNNQKKTDLFADYRQK